MDDQVIDDTWRAVPVPPELRGAVLKEQRSFAAIAKQERLASARWARWSALASNVGTLITIAILGLVHYRQQPQPPQFIVLNRTDAGVAYSAVPAKDAAKLFDSIDRQDDVQKYVSNRLGYIDVMDHEQWATVRAMSTPEQFLEYEAWRKSPLSPQKQLNTDGHVLLTDWMDDPHPIHSADDVWSYTITVRTQQVKGQRIEPGKETWRVTLSFRYVPDLKMLNNLEDRRRNRRGFQCITFKQDQLS
jgi:type IV secretory pathway component VirB8